MAFGLDIAVCAALIKRLPAMAGLALLRRFRRQSGTAITCNSRLGDDIVPRPALCAPGPARLRSGSRLRQAVFVVSLLIVSVLPASQALSVPAGTLITNTARADYTLNATPQTSYSNTVVITTVILGSPSVLETFRYAPSSPSLFVTVGNTSYFDGGGYSPAPAPTDPATGTSINLASPVPLEPAVNFSQDDPVFLILTDPDGNTDPAVVQTVIVDIDLGAGGTVETLLLTETGPDTGVFTGYIRSGAASETASDGILYGYPGAQFTGEYTDASDPTDTSTAPFLFDPAGVLWVTAAPGRTTVSPGDYLSYTMTVENTSGSTVPGTVLTTDLPMGFRYETGSTNVDGTPSADPVTGPDGRSMAFPVGDLAPGQTVTITVVARVGPGAGPGRAAAPNVASSGGLVSNTALAIVRVAQVFNRSRNVIMGRVLSSVCGADGSEGVEGIRIFLEDGTFVITDEMGRYHFEGVRSGTHVVQLDLETVPEMYEVAACDEDTRQAGRAWSRFVDLSGGALWRVDFNLTPKAPEEGQAVLVLKTVARPGHVTFNATMKGEQVPLKNVRFMVTMPAGVEYEPGTARLEGEDIGDPAIKDGTLTWNVGDFSGVWEKGITFETRIIDDWEWSRNEDLKHLDPAEGNTAAKIVQGEMNEVVSSASVMFDTPLKDNMSTPPVENVLLKVAEREETRTKKFVFRPHFATFEARLTAEDREALDILSALFDPSEIGRVQVTGHTDNVPISARGRRVYADNYELSKARARSMARYLRSVWDLPSGLFVIDGKGPDAPLASNDTVSGRTLNRRVEVNVVTTTIENRTELTPISDQNTTRIVIKGLRPGEDPIATADPMKETDSVSAQADPLKDLAWFESANGKLAWVAPDETFSPSVPMARVAVKHKPGSSVVLTVNGEKTDPLTFEGTITNSRKRSALSVWRGVRLGEGDNDLKVVQYRKDGRELGSVEKSVYFAGRPVKVSVVPELSRLTADGRTPPVIAIRLTDKNGKPARPGLVGQYSVVAPYAAWKPGAGYDAAPGTEDTRGQFLIGRDGIARLSLQPTVRSGEAVLKVDIQGGQEEIKAWMTAQREEWILVGIAEGTAGYSTVSGNMQSLEDSGHEEDFYTDGRAVFFAKGRIKGEYLLTAQYDSNGPHGAAGEGLNGTIDPDTYYTLYGDSTEQGYEAPTSKKLYLKIEKRQFYALFGDTQSGLTVTELSRYDRRFTGFRSESKGELFSYNLFAAQTEQAFVRDEIPGDGTSGLYSLSSGDLVVNSESIRIETRDRFQSHVVLFVQELTRHIDYNIDYDDGTLFFKSPVPHQDSGFNPVYIVVDYETADADANGITYGGRAESVLRGSGVTVGVSHIHEDRGEGEGNLIGLDVSAMLGEGFTLTAETAATKNKDLGVESDGSAYTLELTRESDDISGKAYIREQDTDFGLGHQMASEEGMRKTGVEAQYDISESLSVDAEVYKQENLETGAERRVEELGTSLSSGSARYHASIRQATDTDSDSTTERSRQAAAGVKWHSEDNRWDLRADHEQSIGDNDNTDFPTRTVLGSDYRLGKDVSLYAEQEFTDGEETSVSATRVGMKATPWEGGAASTSVDRQYDENGERVYATSGLNQTWQVNERWKVSASLEAAKVMKDHTSLPLNDDVPPATPGEDYTAMSFGAGYTLDRWDFDARIEARNSELSDKWGVISGLFGEPADGLGITTDIRHFETKADSGVDTKETDLRLGMVYRPFERKWTFLDRLDYEVVEETGGAVDLTAWKIINNFNANLKASDDLQVSFRYGAKYVKDTVDGLVYSGLTQLLGTEGRYDLTSRWDIGAWASLLSAFDAGTTEYGLGATVGYGLVENMWLSFGYNLHGFEDSDFSQGDFTAQGPFVKFRIKFDQEDLRSLLK